MDWRTRPPELAPTAELHHHGDARRNWSEEFVSYAYAIAVHEAYAGMPCVLNDDGKVDWTIPSNRRQGSNNWDGNQRRRVWWAEQAADLGIPAEGAWISKTAKAIHPFRWKPCQTCGRWMRLSYCYPRAATIEALNAFLPIGDQLDVAALLDIFEVADHIYGIAGIETLRAAVSTVFRGAGDISEASLDDVKTLLEVEVVQAESRKLSPGAMANPPDRLDGFHTYNLCCRSSQDTGRFRENLRSYGIDRRAFEHWAEGNWEAASLLMSQVGSGPCARCGELRPLTADHVGPISLGFQHTPRFEAICGPCNSAKNNRMDRRDVGALLELEIDHGPVICWQAERIWNLGKERVSDDASALRLSKLMNVNQHEFMRLLVRGRSAGVEDALIQFLSPQYAAQRVNFIGLDPATLQYERAEMVDRQETYARSKAARMIRIAFASLDDYATKARRNVPMVPAALVESELAAVEVAIENARASSTEWRTELQAALEQARGFDDRDRRLQAFVSHHGYHRVSPFERLRGAFTAYMHRVGEVLVERMDDSSAIKEWEQELEESEFDVPNEG